MSKILFALLALALTFGCSLRRETAPPRADSSPRRFGDSPAALRYVVLGDSTAVAVGGDYEQGFAVNTAAHLANGRAVTLVNAAVSGARIHDVLVEQLPRVDLTGADVVLLAVAANDVVHMTRSSAFDRDFRKVVDEILERNCRAKLVVTGSPDMSTAPRIPRLLRPLAGLRSRRLNTIVKRHVARRQLTFAPIYDETGPLFRKDRSLFSSDRFHPNDRGYATWTEVLKVALDEALETQPEHCGS